MASMKQTLKKTGWQVWKTARIIAHRWPCPQVNITEEPHFLFIITPPNSGSTALAQILNTSVGSMTLTQNGEGQWLVPGMHHWNRWSPDYQMNWPSIRAVWLKKIEQKLAHVGKVNLVIEKSPPNLVRIDQLVQTFPNCSLMAFNRNPFANVASVMHRYSRPEKMSDAKRIEYVKMATDEWLSRSGWIQKWLDDDTLTVPYFTYEEFCDDPQGTIAQLVPHTPGLETVNVNAGVKVKDYVVQGISNQNARQIEKLKPQEIEAITERLHTQPALVARMGYDPIQSRPC